MKPLSAINWLTRNITDSGTPYYFYQTSNGKVHLKSQIEMIGDEHSDKDYINSNHISMFTFTDKLQNTTAEFYEAEKFRIDLGNDQLFGSQSIDPNGTGILIGTVQSLPSTTQIQLQANSAINLNLSGTYQSNSSQKIVVDTIDATTQFVTGDQIYDDANRTNKVGKLKSLLINP